MRNYSWPGNVRELRNVIERVVLLSRNDLVGVDDLAIGKEERELAEQKRQASLDVNELGEIRISFPPWGISLEALSGDSSRKQSERPRATLQGRPSCFTCPGMHSGIG